MTDTQQALMDELFNRYGHPSKEAAHKTIYLYAPHPDEEYNIGELAKDDKRALEKIEELENIVEQLKAYRIAIAERYNYLATAPTTPVIEIKRHKGYSGNSKVFYYIYHYSRDLNDNKDILTSTLTFPGTERKKAFEYFNDYVASHPGIITIQNTDKAKWER